MITPFELIAAFTLDLLIGDPRWLPHPVVLIGKGVAWAERALHRFARLGGAIMTITIVGATYALSFYLVNYLQSLGIIGSVIIIYLTSTTLALRGLLGAVIDVFKTSDIDEARMKLSMIVGRDTSALDREGIDRAAIETLAENASDGVIAPLFYIALGGLPMAMAYKAVNTLDSMVGYKNERYREFGWASARLDDIANFIPARITGALMVLSSAFVRKAHAAGAFKIMLRDGQKHSSPNSGIPEAAMAGALGVVMGGPSTYGGVLVNKPFIGDGGARNYTQSRTAAVAITALSASCALGISALALWARA